MSEHAEDSAEAALPHAVRSRPEVSEEAGRPAVAHSTLLSDAALSTVSAVLGTGISGIASIVIARELGVVGRGRWAVIASLATLVSSFASGGLPAAAAYAAARSEGPARTRVVQAAVIAGAIVGLGAGIVYLGAAVVVRPPAPTVAVLVGFAIPVGTVLFQVPHRLTMNTASVRAYAVAQIAVGVITLVAVVVLGVLGVLSVLTVVVISAAAQLSGAIMCVWALASSGYLGGRWVVTGPRAATRVLRPYWSYAVITFVTLSLTQVVQRVDVLLVNGYRGPRAAGLYAVSVSAFNLILVIPGALGFVMFRRGVLAVTGHFSEALRVLGWTALFALVLSIIALLLAGWGVPLLFGSAYRGSVLPVRLLLPGAIAFSLQSVLSNYVAGRGRPRVVLVAWLLGSVICIAADLVVIPVDGIAGAAAVSSLSYIVVAAIHVQALRNVRDADRELDVEQ